MIQLKNVTKVYQQKAQRVIALKNVSLHVAKGEIYGVIGYSGAGKSTLIRLVNYLEKPTEGQVLIEGEDLATFSKEQLRAKRKEIGMIFQHFNLLESKTVYDNIALPLVLLKQNKREIKARVEELLQFVGLEDKAYDYPAQLSGGQKQRVGIARALASHPNILLCDEATSALDPETTESILALLKRINKHYQITILLITHEMDVVRQICHKVAVMDRGEIVEQGPVVQIFSQPKHPTTQSFLQTVMKSEIPRGLRSALSSQETPCLFRLNFLNDSYREPVINQLIAVFGVKVNILYANTLEIGEAVLVTLIVQLAGDKGQIEKALQYLDQQHVSVKEVHL